MSVFGIPFAFVLFGLTLAGVAIFHRRNFEVAVAGLVAVLIYTFAATNVSVAEDLDNHWRLLLNLAGLLFGFAILARHFEDSGVPEWFMGKLPGGWGAGLLLLVGVAFASTFIDNIAAAILGGVVAKKLYQDKVSVGYLAAIVAASNAGGAGSPVGDTTTTMMWIGGVPLSSWPGRSSRSCSSSSSAASSPPGRSTSCTRSVTCRPGTRSTSPGWGSSS